ncbi:MAG: capsule biosynthesis protein CapB [Aminivibrio sp.]|jgi:hypothetical protein
MEDTLPVCKKISPELSGRLPVKILVTGSRGKSSMVRLLTAVLTDAGLAAAGRITGVLPRELLAGRENLILRAGPGSVGEMGWWLRTLPPETEGIVLENSAVAPSLQYLAWHWLSPSCSVLTNVRPDHEDAWGRGEEAAARTLCLGIDGGPVILPESVAAKRAVADLLTARGCELRPCPDGRDFRQTHLSLVEGVCGLLGLDSKRALNAARRLPPDLADFQLFSEGVGWLASAFSANDPQSALDLFRETGWRRGETTVLFNSRQDRSARLKAFREILSDTRWKRIAVTGSRPFPLPRGADFLPIKSPEELRAFIASEGRVFGCGNVAGIPLEYLMEKRGDLRRREEGVE